MFARVPIPSAMMPPVEVPAMPYLPSDLVKLYVDEGARIFKKNLLTPVKSLIGPKYAPDALESVLAKYFGETEFKSALTPLLISSYDLQGSRHTSSRAIV